MDKRLAREQGERVGWAAIGYPAYIWDYLLGPWDTSEEPWMVGQK